MTQYTPDFDSIKQINPYGQEYWSARDLMPLLGYDKWQWFEDAIKRAMTLCKRVGQLVANHFITARKSVIIGHGAIRGIIDYHLTRYALHLLLTHSDLKKPEITHALAYFTLASIDKDCLTIAHSIGVSLSSDIAITREQKLLERL